MKQAVSWKLKIILLTVILAGQSACMSETPPPGMLRIPAGKFIMGTDKIDSGNQALRLGLQKPWFADESPQHKVYLKAFYIDKYEVTNQQYYIFCQATGRRPPPHWKRRQKYPDGTGNLPVTHVSFFDATAYAEWAGKRLPREAEWEKAARGFDGWEYPWGNEFSFDAANLSKSVKFKTGKGLKPVGSYPQSSSPFGTEDMVGNVWEWVWDYYQPYPNNKYESKDYGKKYIVLRGMSYMGVGHFGGDDYADVVAKKARSSYREKLSPLSKKKDVGFRCAKDKLTLFEHLFGKETTTPESKEL